MKAVISVIGKDRVGIFASVSAMCAEHNVNIIDVNQTVMQEVFTMIMMTEVDEINIEFSDFSDRMKKLGEETGLTIHVMHEDIFNSMHRI